MLDWLTQLMAPPMAPSCTPEDIARAQFRALRRRARIRRERKARLRDYARKWPSADDRPATNIRRFSREYRG